MDAVDHRSRILDQFSRQAVPFAEVPAHADSDAMALLVRLSGAGVDDDVMDAGCGPGLVACALAPLVRSVTGTDVTPAMLTSALELARDPSHIHALAPEELLGLAHEAGLHDVQTALYRLPIGLEQTLAASFPEAGGAARVRAMVESDIGVDALGIQAWREPSGAVWYRVPCAVVVGRRS